MAREKIIKKPDETAKAKATTKTTNTVVVDHGKTIEDFILGIQNKKFTQNHISELQRIYNTMESDVFVSKFLEVFQVVINQDLKSKRADRLLQFYVTFMISYEGDETHPIWAAFFNWLLNTKSIQTHVRMRMCQFVGQFLAALNMDAVLDDNICEGIERYMILNADDFSNLVRSQALAGLQRLQDPTNPNAATWKHYFYHLHDPATNVRQAVITNICKNRFSIPKLLDHLMDKAETVRRHLVQSLANVSYKHYKTEDRIRFLEDGLENQSDVVTKSIQDTVLASWFSEMGHNYLKLAKSLLLENSWPDFTRSVLVTKKVLKLTFAEQGNFGAFFRNHLSATIVDEMERICQSVEQTDLEEKESSEKKYENCIELERLSLEFCVFWAAALEYCNEVDVLDGVPLPDLADFINYTEKFLSKYLNTLHEMKKKKKFHFIFSVLVDILGQYGVEDEVCRAEIKGRVRSLILDNHVKKNTLVKLIKIYGEVHPDNDQYLNSICSLMRERLASTCSSNDTDNNSALDNSSSMRTETNPKLRQYLKIFYTLLTERKITHLTGIVRDLFTTVIYPRIEKGDRKVRIWSTKCTATYASLEPGIAKEFYSKILAQLLDQQNVLVWAVLIESIFDLMTHYGIDFLSDANMARPRGRSSITNRGRTLFSTLTSECCSGQADDSKEEVNILAVLQTFYDDCTDMAIVKPIVIGFCRLILSGQCQSVELMTKLLVTFFVPDTDPELVQILGIFFLDLCENQMQELVVMSLLPTLQYIGDNNLNIDMEKIIQFAVDSTEPKTCPPDTHFHSKLAKICLIMIKANEKYKSLVKILLKTVNRLEITADEEFKKELEALCQNLIASGLIKLEQIESFQAQLKIKPTENNESEEERADDMSQTIDNTVIPASQEADSVSPVEVSVVQPMPTVAEDCESEISRSSSKENLETSLAPPATRKTAIPGIVRRALRQSTVDDQNVSGKRLRRDANSRIPVKTTVGLDPTKGVKRLLEKSVSAYTPNRKQIRTQNGLNHVDKTEHIFKTPTSSPAKTKKKTSTPNCTAEYSARIVLTPLDISEVNYSRRPMTRSTVHSSPTSSDSGSRTLRSRVHKSDPINSTTTSTTASKTFSQEQIPNRNRQMRKNR